MTVSLEPAHTITYTLNTLHYPQLKKYNNTQQYLNALETYNTARNRAEAKFKEELATAYLPNATTETRNEIYTTAYHQGHTGGYQEIERRYRTLADNINP